MKREFTKHDDMIDSGLIVARIEELEEELQEAYEAFIDEEEAEDEDREPLDFEQWLTMNDSREKDELMILRKLAKEGEDYSEDWGCETLIAEHYFTEYAQDLAADIHGRDAINEGQWPFNCIDWDEAAGVLQYDYTLIDFDGRGYWIR